VSAQRCREIQQRSAWSSRLMHLAESAGITQSVECW
jgi:hypothetical protein